MSDPGEPTNEDDNWNSAGWGTGGAPDGDSTGNPTPAVQPESPPAEPSPSLSTQVFRPQDYQQTDPTAPLPASGSAASGPPQTGPPPSFQQGPPAGYPQGPPPGGQQGPPPGFQQGPPPGFQQGPGFGGPGQGFTPPPGPGGPQGFGAPPPPPKSNALRNGLIALGAVVVLGGGAFGVTSLLGGDDDVEPQPLAATATATPTGLATTAPATEVATAPATPRPATATPTPATTPTPAASPTPAATAAPQATPPSNSGDPMSEDGEVVPGTIVNNGDNNDITLELLAGERVELSVQSTDFDTVIELLDPSGNQVARDDDGGEGFDSLLTYTVETTGQHVASVTAFGSGTGDFTLTLRFPDGALAVDDVFTEVAGIADGDATVRYDSDLLSGERFIVSVVATDGSQIDPRVTVFDPSGNVLGVDDDGGEGRNALLTIDSVPDSGTYVTEVDSFGTTSGEFEITLTILAAE